MTTTIIISLITVICLILCILFKPYIKIKNLSIGLYFIITSIGAIALIVFGAIDINSVINGITENRSVNPLKILALFLSMTLISVYLGEAGFFEYFANLIFKKSKNGGIKLFLVLYFVVAILTVFTSNDIIILTFTPSICIFSKKAKVSPVPFLVGEFVAANTWSMALIVGNPTNVYFAESLNITFFTYIKYMILPAIAGGLTGLLILLIIFNKTLKQKPEERVNSLQNSTVKIEKVNLTISLITLISCLIFLAISDFIKIEMWSICVIHALFLLVFNIIYELIKNKNVKITFKVIKKEPYELIPFILSMFIIVLALQKNGVTEKLYSVLVTGKNYDAISLGFISALSSNLLNNIPMSVLFEKIIEGNSLSGTFGAIIGSNIGAFITPVGALAGIMWNRILKNYSIEFSFIKFITYGILIAIPTLLVSCSCLAILF